MATTPQFDQLPKRIRELIMADMGKNGSAAGDATPFSFAMSPSAEVPRATLGPVFADDAARYTGTTGPLTLSDVAGIAPPQRRDAAVPQTPEQGALTRSERAEPDFQAMLNKYVPEDDSRSRYLAMAAAFSKPTVTGSFGETMSNVSNALYEQKQNQQKLRAQYTPLIMQQVAQQQAREEQNAYRLEVQQQAQAAHAQAAALAQQGRMDLAAQNQASMDARAAADLALREQLAGNAADLKRDLAPPKDVQKPLPPGALKMQQDALDAIGISSSINSDLGAIEQQIKDGKLKFGPVSNLINKGMNAMGSSTEESRNFGSFTSTLERLRNESLRLNTGVQTDGDAMRAWNELFQNITDTGLVKQRLAEIKSINKRGAELQQLKIDGVRANYGHDPLDTSAQRNVPPALNASPSLPTADAVAAEMARRAAAKKGS
jgi:hypothetical protein